MDGKIIIEVDRSGIIHTHFPEGLRPELKTLLTDLGKVVLNVLTLHENDLWEKAEGE